MKTNLILVALIVFFEFHSIDSKDSKLQKLSYGFCETQYGIFKNRLLGEDASAFSTGTKSAVKGIAMKVGLNRIPNVEETANQILPAILNPFLYYARERIAKLDLAQHSRFSHKIADLHESAEDFGIYALEAHLVNVQRKYVQSIKKHHAQFRKGFWNAQIEDEFIDLCEMTKASVAAFLYALERRGSDNELPSIPHYPVTPIEDIEQTAEDVIKEDEDAKKKKEAEEKALAESQDKKRQENKENSSAGLNKAEHDKEAKEADAEITKFFEKNKIFLDLKGAFQQTKAKLPKLGPHTEADTRRENIFKSQTLVMVNYFLYDFNLRYKHKVLTEFRIADRNILLLNKARRKHMTGITNRASTAFGNLIVKYGDAVRGKTKK